MAALAGPVRPPKNPAVITIDVSPEPAVAGGTAEVTVTIAPKEGIKIAHAFLLEAKAIKAPVDLDAAFDSHFHAAVPDAYKKM